MVAAFFPLDQMRISAYDSSTQAFFFSLVAASTWCKLSYLPTVELRQRNLFFGGGLATLTWCRRCYVPAIVEQE